MRPRQLPACQPARHVGAYSLLYLLPSQSPMINRPENRIPVEVWERILLSVITLDRRTAPVFETTCRSSTYLAFKRTCGNGESDAYRNAYRESEKDRLALRLVCKAWKAFADRWDIRRRWVRPRVLGMDIDEETWRGALRVEFLDSMANEFWNVDFRLNVGSVMRSRMLQWKMLGVAGGSGMRLQRLEMLHLPREFAKEVLEDLWKTSKVLRTLRSLSLAIPFNQIKGLHQLSISFPELTHLTLRINTRYPDRLSATEEAGDGVGSLILRKLETLFVYSGDQRVVMENWRLPNLRHVHFKPTEDMWEDEIYPFLERHASTIESLDLDDSSGAQTNRTTTTVPRILPLGFWDTFSHLQLLRCNIQHLPMEDYPQRDHSLRYLVDTDVVETKEELTKALKPWIEGPCHAQLESIAVYGPYLSRGDHRHEKGTVRSLLMQMRWEGVKLINPAGNLWMEVI